MKSLRLAFLLIAAMALCVVATPAAAARVDISMNVFPTNVALPNNGGTWRLVAKTDSSIGIAGISFYVTNINTAGITLESGIGALLFGGLPPVANLGGVINLAYGQDLSSGPIVGGVGTSLKNDGPDPLGSPSWNVFTKIFAGTYSGVVPIFTSAGANSTDANVLTSLVVGTAAQQASPVTTVVRVAVPEPASVVAGLAAVLGVVAARRRR